MDKMDLAMPVQFVKGVGPVRAKAFAQLGVNTLADLLEYFPRDWIFVPEPVTIGDARPGETVTIVGVIEETDFQQGRGKGSHACNSRGICSSVPGIRRK